MISALTTGEPWQTMAPGELRVFVHGTPLEGTGAPSA